MTNQDVKTAQKKKQSHEYTLNKSKQPNLNEIYRRFPWVTLLQVVVLCIWFAWEPIELLNFTAFTTD